MATTTPDPDIWVVVCQNDRPHPRWGADEGGPLVHETYTRGATREAAMKRADELKRWGPCRIARLVFDDIVPDPSDMLDALRQWRNAERADDGKEFANAQRARDELLAKVEDPPAVNTSF